MGWLSIIVLQASLAHAMILEHNPFFCVTGVVTQARKA